MGLSQVVTLLDSNRNAIGSRVINRGGTLTASFDGIASGTYTLQAELRSQADGGGSTIGQVLAIVDVCGIGRATNTFTTVAGGTIATVQVWPASATVRQNESKQFAATAIDASGAGVFTGSGAFAYDVLGGVGTIDGAGLFLATNPGAGSVRAAHTDSGRTGSATVQVDAYTAPRTKWTILVYLSAANDLYPYSTLNVNQMETVADNPDVRYVLQWKQSRAAFPSSSFDGTRRYLVTPDNSSAVTSRLVQDMGGGVDMGMPHSLRDFVAWGKALYPADRYGLIVWNHGNGWRRSMADAAPTRAVSYDDQTGNAIQIWDLGTALGTERFDFIAWDASLMQMMEVAYEIRGNTPYVIGSEESPPGEGYPYNQAFAPFRNGPDGATRDLTKSFVDAMVNYSPYASRKITQSVIDTSRLPLLATALDGLGAAMFEHVTALQTIVPAVRTQAQSYSPTTLRTYRDLIHVCSLLEGSAGIPAAVQSAAQLARTRAAEAIVWEGHNAQSPNSAGIAIDFSSGSRFSSTQSDYRRLKLAQDTRWDEWLMIAP